MAKQVPQLKFWKTLWWSYRYPLRNWRYLFRVGWPTGLALLIMLVTTLHGVGLVGFFARLLLPIFPAIIAAFMAMMAVAWHRTILLGEAKSTKRKIGGAEFIHFGLMIGVWICSVGIGLTPEAVSFIAGNSAIVDLLSFAIGMILIAVIWVGIALVAFMLPAISVGEPRPTLGKIWELLHYNRLRFLSAMVCTQITGIALIGLVLYLQSKFSVVVLVTVVKYQLLTDNLTWLILTRLPGLLLTSIVAVFAVASAISVLTFAYGGLKRRDVHDRVDLFR